MKPEELDKTDFIKDINKESVKIEWKNTGWKRNCPKCNSLIFYKTKKSYLTSIKNKCKCRKCCTKISAENRNYKETNNPMYGKHRTSETKNKISQIHKNSLKFYGNNNPMFSRKKTLQKHIKISKSKLNKNINFSYRKFEEYKLKMRIAAINFLNKRFGKSLGINPTACYL